MFDVYIKIAKTTQNSWNFEYCQKVVYWNEEVTTSKIIQEISNSNLETGRYGPKSGLAQIIQESWQHCISLRPHGRHLSLVSTKVFLAGPKLAMHLTLPCIFLIPFVVSGGRKVRPDKMKLYKKSFILSLCAPLNFSTWPMEWFWLLYSYHRPTRHSPQQ